MRLGGLGLRSATRMAPAAFWASWVDALPMLSQRLPALTDQIMQSLDSVHDGGCLEQLQAAGLSLIRGGFLRRPEWAQLRAGARPPLTPSAEPGEWQHGWQYHASSPLEHHFRETVILAQSCAADQAHLRSHAGPCASDVFCGAPTEKEFEVEPHLFRNLMLERLRLPLDVTDAVCEYGCRLDTEGRHWAACARCAHGLSDLRELSPAFAARLVRWSDATPNSVT